MIKFNLFWSSTLKSVNTQLCSNHQELSPVHLVQKKQLPLVSWNFLLDQTRKTKTNYIQMSFQFDLEKNSSSPEGAIFSIPDVPGSGQNTQHFGLFKKCTAFHYEINYGPKRVVVRREPLDQNNIDFFHDFKKFTYTSLDYIRLLSLM